MQASKNVPLSDPALDRPRLKTDMCKNVDLPMSAFAINHLYSVPVETVPRPGFNTTGKEVELSLNAYPITKFPSRTVYQYDVHIGTGLEKFIVNKKVWNSRARRAALKSIVYDGSKLAWSMNLYKTEFNEEINLDVEEGRPVRKGIEKDKNTFRLLVRHTRTVNLAVLNAWLSGQASFDDGVLEAMNFLDHVLREHPSSRLLAIKRSFFDENGGKGELGGGVIALKGMYQSIRPAIGGRLIVNVDVSNTCFWARISLTGAALEICDARDHQHLCHLLRPKPDGYGGVTESELFQEVSRRLRKLVVAPFYGGCPVLGVRFTVKGLINGNARQYMVDIKDKATGKIDRMSVEQYFKRKYDLTLNDWALPMVEMTKKDVVYPMEVLTIQGLQRFPFKLNETQTAQMIKYAASRPSERLETILTSKRTLAHDQDPVLNNFGLKISNTMMKTKARLLPSPAVMFGNNQRIEPGVSGRWDLRGKKFYTANPQPLQTWGIGYFPGRRNVISNDQVVRFADNFMKTYAGHGGTITRRPVIIELKEDIGEAIKKLYEGAGKANQEDPQLLLVIVPDKNSFTYTRIKKSCDCRWGVPSQVLQAGHVNRGNPQYVSNVLMKVNAKLGGVTSRAVSKVQGATLRPGSMIIGADVTHPPMGVWSPSMAAVSVSKDPYGSSYFGACEANMDRIEIISRTSMEFMLAPLVREWITTIGQGRAPKYVYYFRDGVSSGQFEHVLNQEVINIKSVITQHNMNQWDGKITVVVANKRHHLRAFPKPADRNAADKNGNPLPGILIEKDVTSPHDWDFLLYSHIALQGTSRPVHYHVILDQIKHKPHELQNMIYDHCYQYIRSTTSVSLYPAIYYAHLIASRARSHEDVPASSGPQSGNTIKLTNPKPKNRPVDPKLLPIINRRNRLPWQMWYI